MVWEISWHEFLGMGGNVMFPLIAVALLLSFCILERLLFFGELRSKSDITPDEVIEHLASGSTEQYAGNGINRRLCTRLIHAKKRYGGLDIMVLNEAKKGIVIELKKNFTLIAALITVAPLLGLLGTVTGMIRTFFVMNISGTGNVKAMSSGISEAMITTQFGLVIAILGLGAQTIIARHARRAETAVEELIRHIIRKFNL
ncbi:MAG: MotA/TolQ/ExbB proton channel family protein [Desulfobacterota bacterium]|nr:MotA/TolQ/ExbB proton channel family protein [Thermodesulfobacteriota bacterium]